MNSTDDQLRQAMCNASFLGQLIQLPPSAQNPPSQMLDELSKALCGPKINETIAKIREAINVGKVLLQVCIAIFSYKTYKITIAKFPL